MVHVWKQKAPGYSKEAFFQPHVWQCNCVFFNEQTRVVTLSNVCSLKRKRGVKSLYSLMNGLYTEE